METKDIKKLFPLKIAITEAHRELAINEGGLHKLGDILLREFLPNELHENIFWGLSIGCVKGVDLKTETEIIDKGKKIKIPLYLDKNFEGNEIIFELR